MPYDKNDLIREFELEHERCQSYFSLMYKTLEFSFVAIVALAACAFSVNDNEELQNIVLCLVLPISLYVFGIMYAYNAYALAVCGKRAHIIHCQIYDPLLGNRDTTNLNSELIDILPIYVATNRKTTLFAYGVPLGFFLTMPLASVFVGKSYFKGYPNLFLEISPYICLVLYYILMSIIIAGIFKSFFLTKTITVVSAKRQQEVNAD